MVRLTVRGGGVSAPSALTESKPYALTVKYLFFPLREASVQEKCSFLKIVQTRGGEVIPMFKNYVVNFV